MGKRGKLRCSSKFNRAGKDAKSAKSVFLLLPTLPLIIITVFVGIIMRTIVTYHLFPYSAYFYLIFGDVGSFVSLSSFITVRQNGAFKESYRKTVSRKDATAQKIEGQKGERGQIF